MELSRKELLKYLGIIGIALLGFGALWGEVTEVWDKLKIALMIAGAVLTLIWIGGNFNQILEASKTRSSRLGANSALVVLAALALFGLVNFLGYRHHKKFDLTSDKRWTLSDQTKKVVSGLNQDIRVLYFSKKDGGVADKIEQYRDLSKRITYERIDLQARPELASQFRGIQGRGETVVMAGSKNERITATDEETIEQNLTSAIMKVTREKAKTIYFTEGHGERELSGGGPEGYQKIDSKLKQDNYETKSVNLVTTNKVPDDCSVLVIAGPKKALFPQEVDMVRKFLDAGGKVFFELDPDAAPEMGTIFADWNIDLRNDTVIDTSGVGRLFGTGPAVPLVIQYPQHPITKDFGRNAMTFYSMARSIKAESKGDITVTDLLKTSEASFGETELTGNQARYDEGKDAKGPLTIGVAASKKIGGREARLVVIGDSDFATNAYQGQTANGDLFVNSVNWLAEEEDLISIRPKSQTNRNVELSSLAQNLLFLLTFAMPLAIIAGGISIWWKRR